MKRYICIHGHFYQPPRENPWTGLIEKQKTAEPFNDWNERINSECYFPNTQTQILGTSGNLIKKSNNFSDISFNVGPTLMAWMQTNPPDTYAAILEADRQSMSKFSGHGSAIAQVYNHMIMPLANAQDKITQVIWGIRDFEYRFNRKPEGMWLAETAVDYATLEVLADHGISYTILSPSQAKQIKPIDGGEWNELNEELLDTQMPYACRLPSGNSITLFFYNGSIANETAFGKLLENGNDFTNKFMEEFITSQEEPRLVHIANDGETYGHHHGYGNVALAFAVNHMRENEFAHLTIYGEFLEQNPPTFEVQIVEDSSWSCYHGVERWRTHCGCQLDGKKKWNQHWRQHLREALDWLRDQMIPHYEQKMAQFFDDPWAVRNAYIDVLLDKSRAKHLFELSSKAISKKDQDSIIKLLEMQKYAMYMYTSCGWFFDDISGLEAIQILRYACRAIQLCEETGGNKLEPEFIHGLEKAKSNVVKMKNGKFIYEKLVKSSEVPLG